MFAAAARSLRDQFVDYDYDYDYDYEHEHECEFP
jgi:hypothetical protein